MPDEDEYRGWRQSFTGTVGLVKLDAGYAVDFSVSVAGADDRLGRAGRVPGEEAGGGGPTDDELAAVQAAISELVLGPHEGQLGSVSVFVSNEAVGSVLARAGTRCSGPCCR